MKPNRPKNKSSRTTKKSAPLTHEEARQIKLPAPAYHATWGYCGMADEPFPAKFLFIDQDGRARCLELKDMMMGVFGDRHRDFEIPLVCCLMTKGNPRMVLQTLDGLVRSGVDVPPSVRASLPELLERHSKWLKLSAFLVDLIATLNRQNVFDNVPDNPGRHDSRVSMAMAQVEVLLRREHPNVFQEEPL